MKNKIYYGVMLEKPTRDKLKKAKKGRARTMTEFVEYLLGLDRVHLEEKV